MNRLVGHLADRACLQTMRWASLLLLLVGCADNAAVVRLVGSPRTIAQIPRASDAPDGLADGFTVTIEKLLIVVSNLELTDGERSAIDVLSASVFNAKKIEVAELARTDGVPAGRYDTLRFDVAPASVARVGNADPADTAFMNEHRYSVYVEGVATQKFIHAFRWGFDQRLRFDGCTNGIEVPAEGEATIDLVVHGERLFEATGYEPYVDADTNFDKYTTIDEVRSAGLEDRLTEAIGRLIDPCSGS